MTARTNAVVGPGAVNQDRWLAGPVFGLGVLDARLHGGDIVRLWTIPVSVSLPSAGAGCGRGAAWAAITKCGLHASVYLPAIITSI